MNSLKFLLSLTILAVALSKSVGQVTHKTEVIVDESGRGWSFAGKPLTKGVRLAGDSEVSGSEADSSDLVVNCGKGGLIAYTCNQPNCRVTVCSIKAVGVTVSQFDWKYMVKSMGARLGNSIDPYLKRQPKPLAILGVRAGGSLSDAVVRKTGAEVHWAPAFRRVLEGSYCMRLSVLPQEGSTPVTVNVNWDRTVDSEGIVSKPDVMAGLYAAEKGSPDAVGHCVLDPDLPAAWILVASGESFEAADREWKEATAQFSSLQSSGASPIVIATFRHAALSYLADPAWSKPSL